MHHQPECQLPRRVIHDLLFLMGKGFTRAQFSRELLPALFLCSVVFSIHTSATDASFVGVTLPLTWVRVACSRHAFLVSKAFSFFAMANCLCSRTSACLCLLKILRLHRAIFSSYSSTLVPAFASHSASASFSALRT